MQLLNNNKCKGCTACCLVESVQEIGKPSYSLCEHACAGCSIYQDRPESCREYTCSYLASLLGHEEKWRPDKCGLLFSVTFDPQSGMYDLWVYETRPNARDDKRIKYLAEKIAKNIGRPANNILFHSFGCKIGANFVVDKVKYPENADVEGKKNAFHAERDGFAICGELL